MRKNLQQPQLRTIQLVLNPLPSPPVNRMKLICYLIHLYQHITIEYNICIGNWNVNSLKVTIQPIAIILVQWYNITDK